LNANWFIPSFMYRTDGQSGRFMNILFLLARKER